jgi:predicted ATP-binding protein involved in virulence
MTDNIVTEKMLNIDGHSASTLSAYFVSITIESVRCFGPKQLLDMADDEGRPVQWTIILGDNGTGKTTLLRSLVALIPMRPPSESPEGNRYPKIMLDFTFRPNFKFNRYEAARSSLAAQFYVGASLDEVAGRGRTVEFDASFASTGHNGVASGLSALELEEFTCFAYGASRRMGETSLSEKGNDAFASLFNDNAELTNAEEWLLQADYTAHAATNASARRQAGNRRDEIKEVLLKLLPDVSDIRFAQLTEKQQKPSVEVKTPYGWVAIQELSLGYKTLIAWMVDFASRMFERYPDSPNPLAEPAVVLVDEIDLHLHPRWQRTLMGYLSERFPNTQFIATAHSPLVVQAAQDANIVLLRREGDHVVIENNVEAVRNWRVDQILTSDLFGLESARPPETEKLLEEKTKILSKARLTKKDRERLKELEEEIGSLPTGETPEEIEAMNVIRRAAERLKAEGL